MISEKMYNFNDDEVELTKEAEISVKTYLSKEIKRIRDENKRTTCLTCGNKVTSFCNSHSIPKFMLKNIAKNGQVATVGSILKKISLDAEVGANKAGTFRLICRDCDSKLFADYENESKYSNSEISQKMLAQIAMKTYLKDIYKKDLDINIYKEDLNDSNEAIALRAKKEYHIALLDFDSYKNEFDRAKKYLDSNSAQNAYYMPYYKKLDYKVSLAFHGRIAIISDFRDSIINDPYNLSSSYKASYLHIAIFPFADYSLIIIFTKDGDKRHRNFFKDLNDMALEEQLQAISYLLFAYSEEVYFAKESIASMPESDFKTLKNDTGKSIFSSEKNPKKRILLARDEFSLGHCVNFPNLLAKDYIGY